MSRVSGIDGLSGPLHRLVARLDAAGSLVEVVGAVIEAAPPVAAVDAVGLLDRDATPVVVVARPTLDAAWLRAYLTGAWRYDGALAALVARNAPAPAALAPGARRRLDAGVLGPLTGGARLLGFLGFAAGASHPALQAVCLHASVRLAELGVTRSPARAPRDELAPLRARGLHVVWRGDRAPAGGHAHA